MHKDHLREGADAVHVQTPEPSCLETEPAGQRRGLRVSLSRRQPPRCLWEAHLEECSSEPGGFGRDMRAANEVALIPLSHIFFYSCMINVLFQ